MTIGLGALLAISTITSLAGAGISYSAQMSAAKQADALAMMNMQSARQAATQNAALQAQGQQMQASQARTDAEMQNIQANAILSRTEAEAAQAQTNIRRANAASEALRARFRSASGRDNVNPDTLSPLDEVLLEAMIAQENAMYQGDVKNNQWRAGVLESFGPRAEGVQSLLRAGFLTAAAENSIVDGQLAGRQAELNYRNELNKNDSVGYEAMGGLFSSVGSTLSNLYEFRDDWRVRYGSGGGGRSSGNRAMG